MHKICKQPAFANDIAFNAIFRNFVYQLEIMKILLIQALMTTLINHGFLVHRSPSMRDTSKFLERITLRLINAVQTEDVSIFESIIFLENNSLSENLEIIYDFLLILH